MSDPSRTTRSGVHLYTLQEVAEKLSVPIGTLYSWASRGHITGAAIAPGGKTLYRLDEIQQIVEATRRRRGRHA